MTTTWGELATTGIGGGPGPQGNAGQSGFTPGGRLTLVAATPIPTADQLAQPTLYYTPYLHSWIPLYNGSIWTNRRFDELSISLTSLTNGVPYDVFIGPDAMGHLVLTLLQYHFIAAVGGPTTRDTPLGVQDGIYVLGTDSKQLYLGTVFVDSAGAAEDSAQRRMVWNAYNQVAKQLKKTDSTSTWSYQTTTWRNANGSSNNFVQAMIGLVGLVHVELTQAIYGVNFIASAIKLGSAGLGAVPDPNCLYGSTDNTNNPAQQTAVLDTLVNGVAQDFYWIEWGNSGGIFCGTTALATTGAGIAGLTGTVWC